MPTSLIKVSRGSDSTSVALDTSLTLDQIRTTLTDPPNSFMQSGDSFLNNGSPINEASEHLIQLSALSGATNAIAIGTGADIGGGDSVQRYNQLSESSKRALFENIQIRRGLTIDQNGQFTKTFKNLYDWALHQLPEANMPRVLTEMDQTTTFNKESHTLETSGVKKGSVSLSSPWGGGSAEYSEQKSHARTDTSMQQYLSERYLSNKVDLSVAPANLQGSNDFVTAVKDAIKGNENSINGYANLVGVLNQWGWYIPLEFTLGGAIFGTRVEKMTSYDQVDSNTQSFGADFKASFDGIGGGAAYSQSDTTTVKDSGSSGSTSVQLLQIGGKAGTATDFVKWNDSLDPAVNWNTTKFQKLYPSLMLLMGTANDALTTADALLQKYNSYGTVQDLQPYIDVAGYELVLAELLNPFS